MKGLSSVKSKLNSIGNKIPNAAKEGVMDVARTIFDDSTNNYVPIDTGELKNSADLTVTRDTKTRYSIVISYSTEYAIYVHEISYYRHSHGQWKYLETPFNKHVPKLKTAIKIRLMGVL